MHLFRFLRERKLWELCFPWRKAPGPDGYFGIFYHHYWDIIGNDVVCTSRDFFSTGRLVKALNATNIVLIPKKGTSFNGWGLPPN